MKSLSTSVVAAALLVAGVAAQDFQINTPNPPTQCVPIRFTWTGGQQPYFLAIAPGGVPGATAFQQYTGLTGNSFTWSTNLSAGTSIGLTLTDANGAVAQSAPVTIQSGPDSSCLTGQQTSGTGAASTTNSGTSAGTPPATSNTAPTNTATNPTTSAATNSNSNSNTATSHTGTSTGTSTGSAKPTGTTAAAGGNGAMSNVASMSLVGVVGAVAAALLA